MNHQTPSNEVFERMPSNGESRQTPSNEVFEQMPPLL